MANHQHAVKVTQALDEAKDNIAKMSDEMNAQQDKIKELQAQVAEYRRKQSDNQILLRSENRFRGYLETLSTVDYRSGPRMVMFPPPYICMMRPHVQSRREAEEEVWVEWAKKELQFAKEMREAFERVGGSSTGASESAGSKRSRDGDSSGSNDGASKRLCSQ